MYYLLFGFLLLCPLNLTAAGLFPELPGKNIPGFNQSFGCIEKYKAESYIQDYNIDVNSFGGLELCDNSVDTKKLFNDLTIIEKGYFSGNKTNMFIHDFVRASEYDYWMKGMTKGIRRGHDIPYATAYNRGGYFTMQNGWSTLSTLGRVGTIIHEARHTAGYSHRACDHGPYSQSNLPGCDHSVEEGGSHGVEMEYYSRVVLQGQNFHPAYTSMARLMNLARANFVFNKYAIKQTETLFVLTNKRGLLLEGNNELSVSLSKEMLSRAHLLKLKRTSYGANLFGNNIALAMDVYSWSQQLQVDLIEDVYSYYKMIKRDEGFNIVDLEEVDFGTKRHLVSLSENNKLRIYNFPKGKWFPGVSVPKGSTLKTVSPTGERGLFVVTKKGLIYSLDQSSLKLKKDLTLTWPDNVKSYAFWDQKLLELRRNQRVYYKDSGEVFSKFDSSEAIIDLVRIPLYNAFDL